MGPSLVWDFMFSEVIDFLQLSWNLLLGAKGIPNLLSTSTSLRHERVPPTQSRATKNYSEYAVHLDPAHSDGRPFSHSPWTMSCARCQVQGGVLTPPANQQSEYTFSLKQGQVPSPSLSLKNEAAPLGR